ncbi:MAG TPA: DUF4403 family protein [Chitinophagaceae bacterium]
MKNITGKLYILTCAVIILLVSCSPKINPGKPSLTVTNFKLDSLPVSEISIPVQVNLKPIYTMAEKSVDTLFTSPKYPNDWVQEACDVRYKYSFRRSPLLMKATGTSMTLGFTGFYKIIGSTRGCIAGVAVSPWTAPCRCGFDEAERRVNVSFTNSLTIQPDYKVKLGIIRNEPQPLDKCEVCFWGQDITKQVLNGLKRELDLAKSDLEKNYGTVDLKSKFQQVWDQLNKAYDLYGIGWLQINPQRIRINSLFAKNDSLNVNLGLSVKPVISFEKPLEQSSWIPNLTDVSNKPGFNIFVDAVLHYDSLSNLLNLQVAGKEFDLNKGPVKKKFIIKDCKLMGADNEKLIIKVNFGGTNEGILYLVGKPVYDHTRKMLEITNIDFDIQSKDALLKAADWLFNKRIVTEISKYARYDLAAYIDTAKAMVGQQLNREWITGIRSYGNINDIKLVGIYPLSQFLVIRSNCNGNLSVKVESINFSL